MFGIGSTELMIILAVVVLLFGAKSFPALGKGMAQGLKNFKKGIQEDDSNNQS